MVIGNDDPLSALFEEFHVEVGLETDLQLETPLDVQERFGVAGPEAKEDWSTVKVTLGAEEIFTIAVLVFE
jgi:hypothetical protein